MNEKLGAYIEQVRGITYKKNEVSAAGSNGLVPIIKANNITENGLNTDSLIYIKKDRIKKKQFICKGDIVLAASSGSIKIIGKNIQFDSNYNGSFGAFCKLVRPLNGLYPKYLYHFFRTPYYRRTIERLVQGANINNLKNEHIDNMLIPLIDMNDQIIIATLLSRIEALIATRKDNLNSLDEFLKSTFLEMFGDPVRNEKGWDKKSINSFAKVRIGPFGSLLHAEDYVINGIPLINPSHIVNGKVKPNLKLSLTEEKYQELNKYHLKKNDVVVARRGEIGRCAIVLNNEKLFCGTGSMFIRIDNNYSPLFLQFQIFNTTLRDYLESKAKGVTMKNLNSKVLGNLEVLAPPDELMNKFIGIINKIESIKSLYQQNLNDLENLYGSVSQKAFKGELDLSRIPLPKVKPEPERKPEESCTNTTPVCVKATPDNKAETEPVFFKTDKKEEQLFCSIFNKYLNSHKGKTFTFDDYFFYWAQHEDVDDNILGLAEYELTKKWLYQLIKDGSIQQEFGADKNQLVLKVKR